MVMRTYDPRRPLRLHRGALRGPPPYTHRHHAGGWGKACPHSSRSGMTVVPPPPCVACVSNNEGALILGKSECGKFEFLHFHGQDVVVCLQCWRYGKPRQNHECVGRDAELVDGKLPVHPQDEYLARMLDVVGIAVCPECEGKCSVWPDKNPCTGCGGTGRLRGRLVPADYKARLEAN